MYRFYSPFEERLNKMYRKLEERSTMSLYEYKIARVRIISDNTLEGKLLQVFINPNFVKNILIFQTL